LEGDAILLGPPFILNETQIDEIVVVLRESIAEVTG
jgi:adenosylmethionine-8-amino-7-oxononanoate aminotransferase